HELARVVVEVEGGQPDGGATHHLSGQCVFGEGLYDRWTAGQFAIEPRQRYDVRGLQGGYIGCLRHRRRQFVDGFVDRLDGPAEFVLADANQPGETLAMQAVDRLLG